MDGLLIFLTLAYLIDSSLVIHDMASSGPIPPYNRCQSMHSRELAKNFLRKLNMQLSVACDFKTIDLYEFARQLYDHSDSALVSCARASIAAGVPSIASGLTIEKLENALRQSVSRPLKTVFQQTSSFLWPIKYDCIEGRASSRVNARSCEDNAAFL
jgi:hypothetical protein